MPEPTKLERRLRWVAVAAALVYWGAMFAGTHVRFSASVMPQGPGDKTIHLAAYAGLAFLWLAAAATFGRVSWPIYLAVLLAAAFYGAVDEVTQSLVGRDTDLADWRFDVLGAALGTTAFAAIHAAYWRIGRSVMLRK